MKKIIFSVILIFCLAQICLADNFLSNPPKSKIGLSFSVSVWDYLGVGNVEGGLGLKYKFSDAWIGRAIIGVSGSISKVSTQKEWGSTGALSFSLGIERHFSKKTFFLPYFGAEVGYYTYQWNYVIIYMDSENELYGTDKQYGYPFTFFLGIECYPWKRISLAVEYKGSIRYRRIVDELYNENWVLQSKAKTNSIIMGIDGSDIILTIYF